MKCGLLGEKLGHSYSPRIHAELADYEYVLYEKKAEEVEGQGRRLARAERDHSVQEDGDSFL